MQFLSSVVADYAFNALWEVLLAVAATAGLVRVLRGVRAQVVHRVWVGCLLLAVVLPALSLVSRPGSVSSAPAIVGNSTVEQTVPGIDNVPQPAVARNGATHAGTTSLFEGVEGQSGDRFPWLQSLATSLLWLYAGSMLIGAVRLLGGLWRTRILMRRTEPANLTPGLQASLQRCLQAFGMAGIDVVSSTERSGPAALSWPRPMMILPAELRDADSGEMEAAFCHELAHLRRGDFLLNLMYETCAVLLFFHPAMHWAMRRLRETREMACDEMAAEAMAGRSEYARSLLNLARKMRPAADGSSLVLGVFDEGTLERRVMNLIEKRKKQTVMRMCVSASAALGLLIGVLVLSAGYGLKPAFVQAAGTTDQAPEGWFLTGSKAPNYRTGVDKGMMHDSLPSAYLAARMQDTGGFGTLMQEVSPAKYAGKRVRLRAWVRPKDVTDRTGLWMRVDKGTEIASFDNMQERPIKGTSGWASYDVVLDVPKDATDIAFGVLLSGPGDVWMNDVKFDVVGTEVATTGSGAGVTHDAPVNLGFQK